MPLGSSSLAPVINPGPSSCRKPISPLRLASWTVVRPAFGLPPANGSDLLTSRGWAPGLTTERMGSGVGSPASGLAMEGYITAITKHGHRDVPSILSSGHNLAAFGAL